MKNALEMKNFYAKVCVESEKGRKSKNVSFFLRFCFVCFLFLKDLYAPDLLGHRNSNSKLPQAATHTHYELARGLGLAG